MAAERSPKPNAMFKATRMCQFYLEGRCGRGSECTFAHGHEQMRQLPDLYKTSLCKELSTTGQCTNGAVCAFAHSEGELRRAKKKKNKKVKQPVDQQIIQFQVAPPEDGIPVQCILPKPGFCPDFDDESDGESRPTFSRRSTDCKSERPFFGKTNSLSSQDTYPFFGKTNSLSSQDTYASHWPDLSELASHWPDLSEFDAPDNELPSSSSCRSTCGAGKIQLEEEQGLAAKNSCDTEETVDLKMLVKNTFLHFEEVSRGCAEKRSKSCRF